MNVESIAAAKLETAFSNKIQTNNPEVAASLQQGFHLLGQSLKDEREYEPSIEGRLPEEIDGTLYRNGPGLFDRNDYWKKHLLDGDGMLQAYRINNGKVHYRNKFVRTEKFQNEQAAGKYLYPTWSTLAPGLTLKNIGGKIKSQAGVTVVVRNNRIFAFDDVGLPYEVDASSLDTLGEIQLGGKDTLPSYNAHTIIDSKTNDWILFGQEYGKDTRIHTAIHGQDGKVKKHFVYKSPRYTFIHDFFATDRYVIFLLHALKFSPFKMLLGLRSLIDSYSWEPEIGNLVVVLEKENGNVVAELDAPPAFMWHSLNAYEQGDEIIADFVGYDIPDHFIGPQALFKTIMQQKPGVNESNGKLRRYVINQNKRTLKEEIFDEGSHEFPIINERISCQKHRIGYYCKSSEGGVLYDGLCSVDMSTGNSEHFSFGQNFLVGETVFVSKPGHDYCLDEVKEPGWLLTQVLDGKSEKSFLAVFASDAISDGPVAKIHLQHHVPISFHGCWNNA